MKKPELAPSSPERTFLSPETTYSQLLEKLIAGKVPIETYGTAEGTKTVHHLLSEINEGESVITIDEKGAIFREVSVLQADVICERPDGVYILKEDRQEFKSLEEPETVRIRRRNLSTSIGEKLKPSELPEDAINRALEEELGVKKLNGVYKVGYEEETLISGPFPGIESTYKTHEFVTVISEDEFKPGGYVEEQADKVNYYVWELLSPAR